MSDARSARSGRTCHTRSEAAASTTSSVRSEARRRAALSKLRAEQGQRAAAAKAELARQQAEHAQQQARQQAEHAQKQAEQAAEQARQQAEQAAEQGRQQAELARQQAELEAQELKDEADRNQLELALLEEEENAFLSADDAVPPIRLTAVAPVQPAGQLCQPPPLSDDAAARTRDWISGLGLQTQPAGATPSYVQQQPENRRPSEPVPPQTAPRLPRLTLEKFSGSALEWPRWIALFKALVHDRSDLSDIERLTYLQAHLTGPAKEAVRGMLCDAGLYSVALQDLEREFGDPSRVVQATLRKLLSTRQVRDGELSALADLSRDLHTAVSVLLSLHYDADLIATTNVTTVAGKLPAGLAWRWGEHVVERDITRPTLVDLDEWLRRQVAAGRVTVTQTGHKQPAKVEVSTAEGRPRRFATASAPTAGRAINSVMTAAIKPRAAASRGDCVICQQTHDIQSCDKFAALIVDDRAALAGRNGLCFNCLGRGHVSAKCPSDVRCGVEHCGKRHHTLLHNSKPVFPRRNDAGKVLTLSDSKLVGTAAAEPRGQVLLQVAPITVHGPAGSQTTHALLDLGSQVTLVTDDLCERLGISGPVNDLVLTTVNGKERLRSRRVKFSIHSATNDEKREILVRDAQTTPTLNVTNHALDCFDEVNWPHLADVQLPNKTRGPVEVLLGADMFELIVPREVVEGPPGTPCAVRTLLGWTVTGRAPQRSVYMSDEQCVHHVRVSDELTALHDLQNQVKQFWTTEAFGTKYEHADLHSDSDKRALSILDSTTKRVGERYETGLLWRDDGVQLPDNHEAAATRLKAVERRLTRDPELCQSYRETVNNYVTEGHASKVNEDAGTHVKGRTWYLPHHAVLNPNKPGKVRVVFDAAARCDGTSLNDNLISGPNNLNSLTGVLMKFRQGRVPIASDVKQMFHQIAIRAEDRQSQRFLWRDMDTTKKPEVYQMNVVIFGAKSSPCTATYVLRRCANDGKTRYPEAADKVSTRFYMDDYLDSVDTEDEGRELVNSLNSLLSAGGFHLTKWISTSETVLQDISPQDRCNETLDLDLSDEAKWTKTLGVHWCAQDDQFRFKVRDVKNGDTKRAILSCVSAVFDPLGILAPFTIRAKCLIQKIWLGGWNWDDVITDPELLAQWQQ